jgi:hypothetical protein
MKLTWDKLVELEPRLADLLAVAKGIKRKRGKPFCANAVWYGHYDWHGRGLKGRLLVLVGYDRANRAADDKDRKVLSTSEAYNIAYDTIIASLPDCRDCLCL